MTGTLQLRDYQLSAIDALRESYARGTRAPLFQLPTAGGKTIIFAEITRSAWEKGKAVDIVVHRRELLAQASGKLLRAGVPHGIIAAGIKPSPDEPIQVASIQSLVRREVRKPDLIVIDEAHHARAKTWATYIESNPQAKLLGVTATPARLDGKGLGISAGGYFDDLIQGPGVAQLISQGFLSKARFFVPRGPRVEMRGVTKRGGDFAVSEAAARVDQKAITGNAVAKYGELADHRPAIAFCTLVSHAERVAAQFSAEGYRAACVHGELPKLERDRLITGLGNGEIEVLTSCDLISEGLDVPALGAVILLRPTASLVLFMQQCGRGMRPAPSKPPLVVLDHVGNIARHGLPTIDHKWSLDGVKKKQHRTRTCPECGCVNPPGSIVCEACGRPFSGVGGGRSAPAEVAGDLVQLSAKRIAQIRAMSYRQMLMSQLSEAELGVYARHRGYKPGWVWHRMQGHN